MSKTVEKEKTDITRGVKHFNLRQKLLSFSSELLPAVPTAARNWWARMQKTSLKKQSTTIRNGLVFP